MKIYVCHASSYDYNAELYDPLKHSPLAKEHDFFFPHDPENLQKNAKEIIHEYDLLLAEVSYPSTGQGIEIGRADAAGVPVLCVHKEGTRPSGALQFVTSDFITYASPAEMAEKLAAHLAGK